MQSAISRYLFVYSSLRRGFHHPAYGYISQYFSFVSDAKVKGVLSDVDGEPRATPSEENVYIRGELYRLNDEHDFSYVFGQLDDYEGVVAEEGESIFYRRAICEVYQDDGAITHAWIYWYTGDVSGKPVIASGDVLEFKKSKDG